MTRTVNANSVKIVAEDSEEGILLSVSQDGKLATNKIDNQGNVDNQASALTSDFISLTDTPEAFLAEKYLKVNAEGNALEFSDISISTNFISLTDTPNAFEAGGYLRVNSSGDAIEQIKTAPPNGGVGDNSHMQAASNFDGKLPDAIIHDQGGAEYVLTLHFIGTKIGYRYEDFGDASTYDYRIIFNNDASGTVDSDISFTSAGSLRWYIDNGRAIFHGQKSGTSGAGSLSVIKNAATDFYTELPDQIVIPHDSSNDPYLLSLKRVTSSYIEYLNEDCGDASSDLRMIRYNHDADGTQQQKSYFTHADSANSLRWHIENGRALYHGHDAVTSRIGQLEDVKLTVPLASQIDIPDAILGKDHNGNLRLFKFTQARADRFDYQSNSHAGNYLFAFNSTTGAWTGGSHAVNVTKEHDDIQGYIAAGRALFYGRTGSNLDQLVDHIDDLSDVDTTTNAPGAGQVLVYDDTDDKWKPGTQSNEFVDLTDTPATLDVGSYLRVNSTGDAIEQIKTAPPDGGVGDHHSIQEKSNFASKLPDKITLEHVTSNGSDFDTGPIVFELRQVSNNKIIYCDTYGDDGASRGYRVTFNNNATGDGWTVYGSHFISPINGVTSPTLQQLIDAGHAIYLGQKSGTSGAGSLSVIKSASDFYTDLPDAIVHEYSGVQFILNIAHVETDYVCYRFEDHGDGSTQDRRIYFSNDADGTPDTTLTIHFTALGNLRWYVENGRALYHGHTDNTGSAGTHPEIQNASNFEGMIPDGIIMKRASIGGVFNYQFNYLDANYIYFVHWTDHAGSSSYYVQCNNDATGSGLATQGANASNYVTPNGETTLKQLIDNGNVVYHGGRSVDSGGGGGASSVEQLTDVDVTTTPPSDGQVLVYDDTNSKWRPGAQSNEFVDLTDTPATLDAGSYFRVNSAGDAIEQIKTAPPDGGAGGNSLVQSTSNFAGKLPDSIVIYHGGGPAFATLYAVTTSQIQYISWTQNSNPYYTTFNNDLTGTGGIQHGNGWSFIDSVNVLQQIIDNGHAVYHGQKSGTSGVGSLNHLKTLVGSSPNGGFYTELPDAILCDNTGSGYAGVFRLHWIKPNTTAGGIAWEIIYRVEYFGSDDYSLRFLADADGSNVTPSNDGASSDMANNNLRWFIENGHAIYNGGYNESNVVSARIGADGTVLSSNYDWIESVTATTGTYHIVFKQGHFTTPPTINLSADVVDGVSHMLAEYNHLTKDSLNVITMKNNDSGAIPAEFCIMAQHQDRPVGLAAPQYGIKAWGVFDGTQGTSNNHTITGFTGGNVASIVRISTGLYRVTFINPMPHADYSVSGSANPWGFSGSYIGVRHTYNSDTSNNRTTTTFVMDVRNTSNVNMNSNRISFQVVC
jgi:hypothetical protein